MKNATRLIFCLISALVVAPLRAQPPLVFEPQVERHEGPPLWISATAVADADKTIDLDRIDSVALHMSVEKQRRELGPHLLSEKARTGLKPEIATIPSTACVRTTYTTDEDNRGGAGSTATLNDLASNSRLIVRGRIRSVDVGFDGGVPASLLAMDVLGVIKGAAPASPVYVIYPVAHFRIGELLFCNTHKGFEPRAGDEALLFAYTAPVDRDQLLFGPRLDQIAFQGRGGIMFLPPQLRGSSALASTRNLDQVIELLRSVLNSSGGAE
jgi:hypothetical protein